MGYLNCNATMDVELVKKIWRKITAKLIDQSSIGFQDLRKVIYASNNIWQPKWMMMQQGKEENNNQG
jgi:hypothetical protein